ncbi:uncharacterized protein [Linepithema humile]|uniref:uncharacterized protein isoform X2 n=1 Tax=Linepithema humile TaxID=83485 RepID=UPI00351E6699
MASRSEVWNYFIKAPTGVTTCTLCNIIVKCAGNTTNLRSHLQKHHPTINLNGSDKTKSSQKRIMEKLHAQMQELKENNSIDTIDIESEYNSTEESISLENSTPKRLKLEEKNLVLTSKFSKSKQLRVDVAFAHQKSYQDGGTKAGEVTNRLLFMLAKDKMPYSTVTNKGFQTFINWTKRRRVV